ncbi:inorganic pyrophosphatase TTM2-like isoform X2 [Zingiber officinale]|uniref:inorganic pyrophosphatase TTM2-like isoform X2 n=1 Tax=Zingiber officinale TaxID=94328 RepID=UPI001C4D7A00|nr:inorganic pyrophosphatase TTM2-like isoform X2 [Zingiber officinale]
MESIISFEEWVTYNPFIISPGSTFEVSVHLLGGLMGLGYTIAAILKRSSRMIYDDKVVMKIDWLEQLNHRYIQVQGKERLYVRHIAEQLGLEGAFIPRTYIEQIQLEKLVNEVMALPDDLRTNLSIDDDMVSSPREALLQASAHKVAVRNKFHKRYNYFETNLLSISSAEYLIPSLHKGRKILPNSDLMSTGEGLREPPESPAISREAVNHLSEQISALNERFDEFSSQTEEYNKKFSSQRTSMSQQNLALQGEACNGSVPTSLFVSNLGNGTLLPTSSSSSRLNKDSSLLDEGLKLNEEHTGIDKS